MEVFNSILLRNLSDNPYLVYEIIRVHKAFEDLGTFTLARGLREIRRVQEAKERARASDSPDKKGKARIGPDEEPHEEKARLLRRETNGSVDLEAGVRSVESLPESQRRSASEDDATTTSPLMSPTLADSPGLERPSARPSEKARGKMRAGRSLSDEMTGSLERIAAAGIGRNGFVPTQEWVRALLV